MADLEAKVGMGYEFGGTARGGDGYEVSFVMDDSFRSWRQIARWNLHYRHWAALRGNVHDLFTKVIRRRLRRRN